jgi:hypothetical protein
MHVQVDVSRSVDDTHGARAEAGLDFVFGVDQVTGLPVARVSTCPARGRYAHEPAPRFGVMASLRAAPYFGLLDALFLYR